MKSSNQYHVRISCLSSILHCHLGGREKQFVGIVRPRAWMAFHIAYMKHDHFTLYYIFLVTHSFYAMKFDETKDTRWHEKDNSKTNDNDRKGKRRTKDWYNKAKKGVKANHHTNYTLIMKI